MKWSKEKVDKQKLNFVEQRQNPTGNFTEFVVRTYYFLCKVCSESDNKMVRSYITNKREIKEFLYKGIYDKPDHMSQAVVDDCIKNLKRMSYIGFRKIENKWMIYIKKDLDFLLPGEHEKYIELLEIVKGYIHGSNESYKGRLKSEKGLKVYKYKKPCYNCGKETEIITYITCFDNQMENFSYPWDKNRILKGQDVITHLMDPSIEYYGINVVGDIEELDKKLLDMYPKQIAIRYSNTTKTKYPMNICMHCGAIQGRYFVYRDINKFIEEMRQLELFAELPLDN